MIFCLDDVSITDRREMKYPPIIALSTEYSVSHQLKIKNIWKNKCYFVSEKKKEKEFWIISPDTNIQEFQACLHQCLLPSWVYIVSYLHQHLAMLKFLIFANIVGQMLPVMVLICILSLLIIYVESFYWFLYLLSMKRKCLLVFFDNFYWLFAFTFSICKFSLWNCISSDVSPFITF